MTRRRRILCVHDHTDMCDLIISILKTDEVITAPDRSTGLRAATHATFDLYLLGEYLPDGDGFFMSLLIRVDDHKTPILIMSDGHHITSQQVEAVGAQGIVCMSELPDSLLDAVTRLFG
jgi:DNA-binding response OmpR family regulator